MDWYPIFLRDMLLFKRKLLRLGYLFSAMVVPIIYLLAFGLGLGRNVAFHGQDYLAFLIPGLVAMSSMNNSYTWVASSLNLNRLYFKTFQIFIQAPISPFGIMFGYVLSGIVKGLFASSLIIVVGYLTSSTFKMSLIFILVLLINCFMFASLGVITGMITKSHEDTATYSNFFIMPMAFFSGTFFPVEKIPGFLKPIIYVMPLTHTNLAIRHSTLNLQVLSHIVVIICFSIAFFLLGLKLIRNYRE